jgi:hypothetical protein
MVTEKQISYREEHARTWQSNGHDFAIVEEELPRYGARSISILDTNSRQEFKLNMICAATSPSCNIGVVRAKSTQN